jgi:hypothetical protein
MRREKDYYKDITKSVIVNNRFVPQLKRCDGAYVFTTKALKVSQRTVVRQPFVLLWCLCGKKMIRQRLKLPLNVLFTKKRRCKKQTTSFTPNFQNKTTSVAWKCDINSDLITPFRHPVRFSEYPIKQVIQKTVELSPAASRRSRKSPCRKLKHTVNNEDRHVIPVATCGIANVSISV